MARGSLPLLALFLLATAIAATMAGAASKNEGIESFCKGKLYEKVCLIYLGPVATPTTNFQSLEWRNTVLKAALKRAEDAKNMVLRQDNRGLTNIELKDLKTCQNKLSEGVNNLQKAMQEYTIASQYYSKGSDTNYKKYAQNAKDLMGEAAFNHESCDDLLNGNADQYDKLDVDGIRSQSDESRNLNIVAQDIIFPVSEFPDKY